MAACVLLALLEIGSAAATLPRGEKVSTEKAKLVLFISCDIDCAWTLDGGQHGVLKKDQEERIQLPTGKHRLEATSSDGQSWAETFEIKQSAEERIGISFPRNAQASAGIAPSTVPDVRPPPMQAEATSVVTQDESSGIPRFYAEARQMLVEAAVYDKKEKAGKDWVPDGVLRDSPALGKDLQDHFPRPATGLAAKDIALLDNGSPQSINFLKEQDFIAVNLTREWALTPHVRGTWGRLPLDRIYIDFPVATYLVGFVPSVMTPGECHKLEASAGDHLLDLNRRQYCDVLSTPAVDSATKEGTPVGKEMRSFARTTASGSIAVSARAFTFWSSGVLSLAKDTSPNSTTETLSADHPGLEAQPETLPPADFTYRVRVHDSKAPAIVRVVSEFVLPHPGWDYDECRKNHPAVHVLGIVYTTAGEKVKEFGDTFTCYALASDLAKGLRYSKWWQSSAPTRFETQVELAPGSYEIRTVVSDGKKEFGRSVIPAQVSPFDGHQLMMSDVVIGGILRDASWVLRDAARIAPAPIVPTPLVSKNVEFFPSVQSTIVRYLPLSFYFEIYEPLLEAQKPAVFFSLKIMDTKDGSLVMNTGPVSAASWTQAGNVVIPIGLKVATQKLPSGSYKLQVQASDSAGRQTPWREASFIIP